jgi:protein O-mannosyl-transferase
MQPVVNATARPKRKRARGASAAVAIALFVLTWAIFGQTVVYEFVEFRDDVYVYENPQIKDGLTWNAVKWAFTEPHAAEWHPLTTLSHIADWQLFGDDAGLHHGMNVLLHSLAAVALFLVLHKMTDTLWRSSLVAALFAVHPLRVESVAWVAQRKDVLSAFLFMLTLAAYERYVRRRSFWRYAAVIPVFTLGLLAKPAMLAPVPLVLLLLDRWPLRRFGAANNRRSVGWMMCAAEKLPLLALSAAASAMTFLVQTRGSAQSEPMSVVTRLTTAALASATYLRQLFWPADLAPIYPPMEQVVAWQIGVAAALLIGITALMFIFWKTRPYLATGWLWFLAMLVPVIGFAAQAPADRHTYLPHIGLLILGVWTLRELARRWRIPRVLAAVLASLMVAGSAVAAWTQTSHWRNTESLWAHTVRVTPDSVVAQMGLGNALLKRADLDGALSAFERALEIRLRAREPGHDPVLATIHNNIGVVLQRKGRIDEAIAQFSKAIEAQPDYAEANENHASALRVKNEAAIAIEAPAEKPREAIRLELETATVHILRGDAFLRQGAVSAAIESYERALATGSDELVPLQNLAWIYATSTQDAIRNGVRAQALAETAVRVSGGTDPLVLRTLAAAQAENGDFASALATAERARALAAQRGHDRLVAELDAGLERLRNGLPIRSRVGGE